MRQGRGLIGLAEVGQTRCLVAGIAAEEPEEDTCEH